MIHAETGRKYWRAQAPAQTRVSCKSGLIWGLSPELLTCGTDHDILQAMSSRTAWLGTRYRAACAALGPKFKDARSASSQECCSPVHCIQRCLHCSRAQAQGCYQCKLPRLLLTCRADHDILGQLGYELQGCLGVHCIQRCLHCCWRWRSILAWRISSIPHLVCESCLVQLPLVQSCRKVTGPLSPYQISPLHTYCLHY